MSVELIDQVKVIDDMTDYNFGNILKGKDTKWLTNRQRLCGTDDTILGIYFSHTLIKNKIYEPGYNTGILKLSIDRYIKLYKPPQPPQSDCCVYIRLGDTLFNRADKSLSYNYIEQIAARDNRNIVIVCCISFCGEAPDEPQWRYTHDKVKYNKLMLSNTIDNIKTHFPKSSIRIQSSSNPDHDICFLYKSDFVADSRATWKKILGHLQ